MTNGLSGHILLSLIPATKPDEPASRKHFPYCCSEKGAADQEFRTTAVGSGGSLAENTEFRVRPLINCLHKHSSSTRTVTQLLGCPAAAERSAGMLCSLKLCHQRWGIPLRLLLPTQCVHMVIPPKATSSDFLKAQPQILAAEFVVWFSRGSFWAFHKYLDYICIT